jgi:hypothetical protein
MARARKFVAIDLGASSGRRHGLPTCPEPRAGSDDYLPMPPAREHGSHVPAGVVRQTTERLTRLDAARLSLRIHLAEFF